MAFLFLEGAPVKKAEVGQLQRENRRQMLDFLTRLLN
jgi:hypothetical protein